MIKFLRKILSRGLFYDRWTCNACKREIFEGYFCSDCLKNIEYITKNKCFHCGRITPYAVNYCDSCIEKNLSFDRAISVFNYKKPISYLIQNLKYKGDKYLANYFASEMYSLYKRENILVDGVLFVPMHQERLEERKFNHAKLLAEKFCELSGLEIIDCAYKVKETLHQVNLSLKERLDNLSKSFKVDKKLVKDRKLLVIDDVLTTGATAETLSKALKKGGAKSVTVLTIASVSKHKNYNDLTKNAENL